MTIKKKPFAAFCCLMLISTFAAFSPVNANEKNVKKVNEYKSIVKHLKTRYKAKKVSIPMMWLARVAVKIARPAGVQSFSLTMFENLQFSSQTLDAEMQSMMKKSFAADWSPIFHVRARDGQQIYMYMREAGKSVEMTLVTIDKTEKKQAVVVRAKFSPEKFIEFVADPKMFGISIGDDNGRITEQNPPPEEVYAPEKKDKKNTPE